MTKTIRKTLVAPRSLLFLRLAALALLAAALLGAGAVLAAGPVYWDWPAGRGFGELEREGVALDPQDHLARGLDSRQVGPAGPEVYWHLAADGNGGAFLGSGHGGELYHLDRNGGKELVASLEGPEIFSILHLADGVLLAGCGPDGQVYRVDKEGEVTLLGKVEGGYVWAMLQRPDKDEIWLATGSPAAVYRIGEGNRLELVRSLAAQNCLTLAFSDDGFLLAGTQGPGLVYRLDLDDPGPEQVLFQTAQDEVRQFIHGPEGSLFFLALDEGDEGGGGNGAGTKQGGEVPSVLQDFLERGMGPSVARSAIYRLDPNGEAIPYWSSDLDLMIVAWSRTWGWLGGGSLADETGLAVLHRLVAPADHYPVASWAGGDILDLLVRADGKDKDRILVAQAHPGTVREVGRLEDARPVAVSPPLDGRQQVLWGRLRWSGEGRTKGLRWSVRGGNQAEPDDSWTPWSDSWQDSDHAIELAPCRFLQWRVEFPGSASCCADGPHVTGVSVSAWQDNLPPVVRQFVLEKVSDISLGGMMNGNDNVTQTFRSGLKAEFSRDSRQDQRAEGARAAVTRPLRVFTWQGGDPNGDRLVYSLEYERRGEQAWRKIIPSTEENIGSWDTSEVPDGRYLVRLIASDEKDNPAALAFSTTAGPLTVEVDNTPPKISDFDLEPMTGGFRVDFAAEDAASSLAGAVIQLPDGSWQRLDPVDLICDSKREVFSAGIDWPCPDKSPGEVPWTVHVEVRDLAGNRALAQGVVVTGR